MKVLVTGGRDFTDRQKLFDTLDSVHAFSPITKIIAGGARGADTLAIDWAVERGIPYHIEKAKWDQYGSKVAGIIRNKVMLEMRPNLVVAFKGGNGTSDMVSRAKKDNVEVHVVR